MVELEAVDLKKKTNEQCSDTPGNTWYCWTNAIAREANVSALIAEVNIE
jgi:hypothetical protein